MGASHWPSQFAFSVRTPFLSHFHFLDTSKSLSLHLIQWVSWTTGTCKGGDSEEVAKAKGSEWSVQQRWEGYDNQGIYTKDSKAHDHSIYH